MPRSMKIRVANGKRRMAGKLARTCTTGWANRASFGLMPIFTPMGTQMSVEIVSRTTTLAKVAKSESDEARKAGETRGGN